MQIVNVNVLNQNTPNWILKENVLAISESLQESVNLSISCPLRILGLRIPIANIL